jgi:hypothetical protein
VTAEKNREANSRTMVRATQKKTRGRLEEGRAFVSLPFARGGGDSDESETDAEALMPIDGGVSGLLAI